MRGGLLLLILGAFVVTRTITHDSSGRTLVDRLLGSGQGATYGDNQTTDATGNPVQRSVAPNRLAPQMALNNTRLRVQQAFRVAKPPAAADVALLTKNYGSDYIGKLYKTTVGGAS